MKCKFWAWLFLKYNNRVFEWLFLRCLNKRNERWRTEQQLIDEECICDFCVYASSCDAGDMCEECEEFEREATED